MSLPDWYSELRARAEALPARYRVYALQQCQEAWDTCTRYPGSATRIAWELTEEIESLEFDVQMETAT